MIYLWMGLTLGAASFAHCLGMCGPIALHVSGGRRRWATLTRQLAWHAGRTFTYVFLGALAGFAGSTVAGLIRRPWTMQVLAMLAGAAMIAAGVKMTGLLRRGTGVAPESSSVSSSAAASQSPPHPGLLTAVLGKFFVTPTTSGTFVLGLLTGFLPCGVVYAALALAAATGQVTLGMAAMAGLGIGSAWALLLLGLGSGSLHAIRGRRGAYLAGGILVLAGLVTSLRGTDLACRYLPHPGITAAGTAAPSTEPACCCGSHTPSSQVNQSTSQPASESPK